MAAKFILPNEKELLRLLADMAGKKVEVKMSVPWIPTSDSPMNIATYVEDSGAIGVICLCDISAGASIGASLTRIPVGVMKDDIDAKKLSDSLLDNLREVLNICASLLNTVPSSPHLRLHTVFSVPPVPPEEVLSLITSPVSRLDFEIAVESYGKGKLSFLSR